MRSKGQRPLLDGNLVLFLFCSIFFILDLQNFPSTPVTCGTVSKSPSLTALLRWVTPLQVIAGPGGVLPAAVWALHAVDLAAEGLQRGLDAGVHHRVGGVTVGQSFVLAELRRRRWTGFVIMRAAQEIIQGSGGRSWGTWRTWGTWLSRRPLSDTQEKVF